MRWRARAPRAELPGHVVACLADYGRACAEARRTGHPIDDPRFDWAPFLAPVHLAILQGAAEPVVAALRAAALADPDPQAALEGVRQLLAELDPALGEQASGLARPGR